MSNIIDLEPKRLWYYFNEISKIPRGSGNEGKVREFIIKKAQEFSLEYVVDETGNILVRKEGKTKNSTPIILQGHMDMVCEKDDGVEHDFTKDTIQPFIDGDWIKAKGTTLGGDNGIALAASLAVMEDKTLIHGPLEFLFTVEEETTMRGALSLKKDFLRGRTLLNMDSEEEGKLFISCSSSEGMVIESSLKRNAVPAGCTGLKTTLQGLLGGHSGLDIHLQRGNSVKLLTRILLGLKDKCNAQVSIIKGGERPNAIPRDATALIAVNKSDEGRVREIVSQFKNDFKGELGVAADGLGIKVESAPVNDVLDNNDLVRVLKFISLAPSAPFSLSPYVADLVQTSCNLGITDVSGGGAKFVLLRRSSVPSESASLRFLEMSLADLCGFKFTEMESTPGWKPNVKSVVLKTMRNTAKKVFDQEPEVKGMHASLECAVIGEKYPDMDMISFGVTIENCHSPSERVNIKTVGNFWKWLTVTLEDLTK